MALISEAELGAAIGVDAGSRLQSIHGAADALCRDFVGLDAAEAVSEKVPEAVFSEAMIRTAAWLRQHDGMLQDSVTVGEASTRFRALGNVYRQSGAGTILAPFVRHGLEVVE